jgi:hypothetical protein
MKRMILIALFSLVCTAWAVEPKDACFLRTARC